MAQPIICNLDNVEKAKWLIGELDSGDQVALCDACFIGWCLARLDIALNDDGKAAVVNAWTPKPAVVPAPEGSPVDAAQKPPRRPGRQRRAPDGQEQAEADQHAALDALAARGEGGSIPEPD